MTATRTISTLTQILVAAAVAIALFGAVQALANSASATSSTYTPQTYGSAMLDMGEQE